MLLKIEAHAYRYRPGLLRDLDVSLKYKMAENEDSDVAAHDNDVLF